ncbi:hypothetical protein PoB_002277800 [Plakobranchus ocellatus]|uniref:Uncharacterized protein n=1 Tax=Plakobranchus ocellatus TaxID=259542 RepID=A0AAV3ZN63_9GAST|nr:hypothetical protein PoB_002277800 [Plakobranchus ocellatus]
MLWVISEFRPSSIVNSLEVFLVVVFLIASPQQGDLGLSGPLSGQGAGGGARTRHRWVPENLRANLLSTVPPMPMAHPNAMTREEQVEAYFRVSSLTPPRYHLHLQQLGSSNIDQSYKSLQFTR